MPDGGVSRFSVVGVANGWDYDVDVTISFWGNLPMDDINLVFGNGLAGKETNIVKEDGEISFHIKGNGGGFGTNGVLMFVGYKDVFPQLFNLQFGVGNSSWGRWSAEVYNYIVGGEGASSTGVALETAPSVVSLPFQYTFTSYM